MTPRLLAGQRVLVTGAGRGLGVGFCQAIAAAGGRVLALGRDAGALAGLLESLPGEGHDRLVADVTEPHQLEQALAGQRFNSLVNNAGIAITARLQESSPEDIRRIIDTNLLGSLFTLQASLPALRASGGGVVVNITSVLGHRPLAGAGIYAISKAALMQMTRAAAMELAAEKIRVNALAPGYVETEMNRHILAGDAGEKLKKRIPLSRFASAEDLVPALLLLLNPANSYMTGATLTIDGGMSAGL